MNVSVKVSALVYPTEVREKVETALKNIFPVELRLRDFGVPSLYGEGDLESLRRLHLLLRDHRILDTARHVMLRGIQDSTVQFLLNKQVAFVGKVNFPAGEETMGSIFVEIAADNRDDIVRIIDWLAPETSGGKPIKEIEL